MEKYVVAINDKVSVTDELDGSLYEDWYLLLQRFFPI